MSEPLPEQIGKYPIIRRSAEVHQVVSARDPFADREVAIKVIRNSGPGHRSRAPLSQGVPQRSRAGRQAVPSHILTIYDAVSDDNVSYT
jgi:hypothetical protein